MPDNPDPLIHLSAIAQALQEAEAAIVAASLGIESQRAATAASGALVAPQPPSGPDAPAA